jgi:adenosylcobinamide-GDP ribazoletransferase
VSGFCAISFRSAKEGTLNLFAKNSSKIAVQIITCLEAIICIVAMFFVNPLFALGITVTTFFTVLYYYFKTKKEFGGITGDTAGYLLLIVERNAIVVLAIIVIVLSKMNFYFR